MTEYCWENHKKTRAAFLGTRLLNTPFWAMFNMIPFILFKELTATPTQVTAALMLKPAVSLIALYWISGIVRRRDRLLNYVMGSHLLAYLPFFLLPFIHNAWFMVFAFGFYMTLYRGSLPAWVEILKLNLPGASRSRVFAFGSSCGYVGDALWPLLFGYLLDGYNNAWQWILPITAVISMTAYFLQRRITIVDNGEREEMPEMLALKRPWHRSWQLLKKRPDFFRYQIGFMLGGAGVMILQPALPQFFMNTLNLSYTEIGAAITLCKGIGFALSSQVWARWIHKVDIFRFASWVTLIAALFPLCVFASQYQLLWLYCGYIFYGVMQGGSELSWNMSGPIFSRNEDSAAYSSVNILTQGIRGCFIPVIGGILTAHVGAISVMVIGCVLSILATQRMNSYSKRAHFEGTAFSLEN